MAVELGKLVANVKQGIALEELAGKRIAIDAYNTIYQFLSIIRQPDGSPLTDMKGRVTSHLSGLLYRTSNLLDYNITPVFIFDGIPPALKQRTIEARMNRRKEALEEWEKAKAEGMIAEARTHAMASTRISKEIVESSKELLTYMGIPWMQAPSEGEAQASRMVRDGLVYAAASQDYDSFLFGADIVIRNLTITGKRKLPMKNIFIDVKPERIFLKDLLKNLDISYQKLIWLGILVGTDFNAGIEKVGPKTALKIVTANESLRLVAEYVREKYQTEFDVDPAEVEKIFLEPDVATINQGKFEDLLKAATPSREKIIKFMVDEHGFSAERITKYADKMAEAKERKGQKGMGNWL